MLDGMMHASEQLYRKALLLQEGRMAPLTNEPNDDLSARTLLEFLAKMLPRDYGCRLNSAVPLLRKIARSTACSPRSWGLR
ncbi:hypothetical protein GQ600_11613 [Phytophthora cactorum]|nr:hypothetical protein GQ600_11613 [Phytophthora cactorum]